jgi:hypothetical protein
MHGGSYPIPETTLQMTSLSQPDTSTTLRSRRSGAATLLERLGRFGYIAKGVVYIVVGLLALRYSLWGEGWSATNSKGALETIFLQPLGGLLLVILTAGLAAYALWQLVAPFVDGEHDGTGLRGYLFRAGKLLGAAGYGVLTFQAVRTLAGHFTGSREKVPQVTAMLFALPGGRMLTGVIGTGIFIFGAYQIYQTFRPTELAHLDLDRMSRPIRTTMSALARFGSAARAVVFLLIGRYLVKAALEREAGEATGLSGAFAVIGDRPFGVVLLSMVAAGLVSYGIYQMLNARYRRLDARVQGRRAKGLKG